ncbi:neuralized-like protein 4 [Littorina saxatilis]|uniref:neuralized-like protein 4 n=1 Tax=Littorina saxatilis TaxID=31220 RepID=UPI0038B430CD
MTACVLGPLCRHTGTVQHTSVFTRAPFASNQPVRQGRTLPQHVISSCVIAVCLHFSRHLCHRCLPSLQSSPVSSLSAFTSVVTCVIAVCLHFSRHLCHRCLPSPQLLTDLLLLSIAAFRFHDNHGKRVVLSNDQQTAKFPSDYFGWGIVMSRDPMEVNKLYEVQITKRCNEWRLLCMGVVTSSPESLTLPHRARGWQIAETVYGNWFADHGDWSRSDIEMALWNFPVNSRFGLRIDSSRRLHLHVDGIDCLVVPCRPLPDKCWAMWDLDCDNSEIKSLPVRDVGQMERSSQHEARACSLLVDVMEESGDNDKINRKSDSG